MILNSRNPSRPSSMFSPSLRLQVFVLSVFLALSPLRRSEAEDRFDLKFYYYLEDGDRTESWGPSFSVESALGEDTVLKIDGVFDVLSGATPTGAPPVQKTRLEEVQVTSQVTSFVTVSGASGQTSSRAVSRTVTDTELVEVPYGSFYVPTAEFEDERLALNGELTHRIEDYLISGGVAVSTESDYDSYTASFKLGKEFNNKLTTVNAGVSGTHDSVKNFFEGGWEDKETVDAIAGLTQVIDKNTLLTLNYSFGHVWGYLNDQYKSALVGDVLLPDKRPGAKDRHILYSSLNRFIEPLNGSIEASYRFYTDDFGIDANTFGFTWHQKIGDRLVLSPGIRYYEQSAADFYAVQFDGNPKVYSADYRLSKLYSVSYGMRLFWKITDKVGMHASYERYNMGGRDAETAADMYPDANMATIGVRIWF